MNETIPSEIIETKIHILRGQKIILDKDLAILYNVSTRDLNKAVKRNEKRFPDDFIIKITQKEFNLMFHTGTSSWGGTRKLPTGFTENGIAMLSGILNSDRAIQVNIQIMRTFTKLRKLMIENKDIHEKISKLEKEYKLKFNKLSNHVQIIFDTLNQILSPPTKHNPIGFIKPEHPKNQKLS